MYGLPIYARQSRNIDVLKGDAENKNLSRSESDAYIPPHRFLGRTTDFVYGGCIRFLLFVFLLVSFRCEEKNTMTVFAIAEQSKAVLSLRTSSLSMRVADFRNDKTMPRRPVKRNAFFFSTKKKRAPSEGSSAMRTRTFTTTHVGET